MTLLPTYFEIKVSSWGKFAVTSVLGKVYGNVLTDNAWVEDGYRFHDVVHLGFAAFFGWSPVTVKLVGLRTPSQEELRVEEAIAAYLHPFYEDCSFVVNLQDPRTALAVKFFLFITRNLPDAPKDPEHVAYVLREVGLAWATLIRSNGGHLSIDGKEMKVDFR